MATQKRRYHPKKWAGVYVYETSEMYNSAPDLCFYITFKSGRRLIWEKVGKISEGYGPDVAAEIRAERIKAIRHGDEVKTTKEIRREQAEKDKPFAEIADAYFEIKGPNALELLRRIINFGLKTNRCPALRFQIEMPVKDNEVIEHLTPGETRSFLDTARTWPAKDVGNMLLLAFFTGMRRGEIFKLRDEDVAFDLKLIRLRDPKGRKTLSIGMSALVENLLRGQMDWRNENYPGSPYLFPGKDGEMRKDCSAVDRFRKQAGLPPGFRPFHGLRHHFAVSLANSGKFSIDMISEMLTHKNVDFTRKKYAQFLPETLVAASNAAADILSGRQ